MKIKSSPALFAFYQAYDAWLRNGAPEDNECNFTRYIGLCANAHAFVQYEHGEDAADDVEVELSCQFHRAGLNEIYPFGYVEYEAAMRCDTMHLDPNRIEWVRKRIADGVHGDED